MNKNEPKIKINKYFIVSLIVNLLSVVSILLILMRHQNEALFDLSDEISRFQAIANLSEDYKVETLKLEITAYTSSKEECGKWFDNKTQANVDIKRFRKLFGGTLGIVAVDYNVVPRGTLMIIPRAGVFLACDVGGAIKGHKADLLMYTKRDARNWGRRKDYVLLIKPRKAY